MAPGGPGLQNPAPNAPNGATATHLVAFLILGSFLTKNMLFLCCTETHGPGPMGPMGPYGADSEPQIGNLGPLGPYGADSGPQIGNLRTWQACLCGTDTVSLWHRHSVSVAQTQCLSVEQTQWLCGRRRRCRRRRLRGKVWGHWI